MMIILDIDRKLNVCFRMVRTHRGMIVEPFLGQEQIDYNDEVGDHEVDLVMTLHPIHGRVNNRWYQESHQFRGVLYYPLLQKCHNERRHQ
jgi:hypothetical protein